MALPLALATSFILEPAASGERKAQEKANDGAPLTSSSGGNNNPGAGSIWGARCASGAVMPLEPVLAAAALVVPPGGRHRAPRQCQCVSYGSNDRVFTSTRKEFCARGKSGGGDALTNPRQAAHHLGRALTQCCQPRRNSGPRWAEPSAAAPCETETTVQCCLSSLSPRPELVGVNQAFKLRQTICLRTRARPPRPPATWRQQQRVRPCERVTHAQQHSSTVTVADVVQ